MGRKSRKQIMAEASKSLTETPEFRAAVAEAVKVAAPQIIDAYKSEILASAASAAPGGDARDFMSQLALAIGELNDQGSGRKRVAPEILMQRARAHEKMNALIEQYRGAGKQMRYRLIAKVVLNERLIDPWRRDPATKQAVPQTITWNGEPNDAMVPLNDEAKAVFTLFRESRGSTEKLPGPARRAYLTNNGLVVEGTAPAPRRSAGEDILPAAEFANDVVLDKDGFNPNAPQIHILGTIAPPARQNVGAQAQA